MQPFKLISYKLSFIFFKIFFKFSITFVFIVPVVIIILIDFFFENSERNFLNELVFTFKSVIVDAFLKTLE